MLLALSMLVVPFIPAVFAAARTDIDPPASHSQTEGTVGYSYVFAEENIREEITEQLNVLDAGLAWAVGDLAGTGTDTIRITRFGGLGFAERMTAMDTETEAITPSGYTLGLDTLTIARYGMAKEQTFQDQGLQRRGGAVDLGMMIASVPKSWIATLRYLVAQAGSTFATGAGTSGEVWTMDDELELIADFHETDGFDPQVHFPRTLRAPKQYTQFRNALRSEPGFQNDAQLMQALMGLGGNKGPGGSFSFLGFVNFSSHDVPTSAGDYVGSAWVPGAIMWGVMSPSSVRTTNPSATMVIPEYGVIIIEETIGGTATGKFTANAWIGVDTIDPTLAPQFKLTSVAA